ncbi:hypothetical protein [Trichormus azollae]|uniref:hypothetical protein n=1 Tax=Trichormus azollae TaxID=1164 RepID=UPI0002EEBDAE|nr:hypothetical protein [Trichormus azollae]
MGTIVPNDAETSLGCGYISLLPRTKSKGNRQSKVPTQESELHDKFITDYFETPKQAPAASVYRAYIQSLPILKHSNTQSAHILFSIKEATNPRTHHGNNLL